MIATAPKFNGLACYRVTAKYQTGFAKDYEQPARITPKRVYMKDGKVFARDVYGRELAPIDFRVSSSYQRRLLWFQVDGGERVTIPGVPTLPP